MKPYKRQFNENGDQLGTCGKLCKECETRCSCGNYLGEDCSLEEDCPEGSKPRNGKCARKDNSGYLKGHCAPGYIWDKTREECVHVTK